MVGRTTSTAPVIHVSGLSRHFGDLRAVDDVTFAVAAGAVFGFIGPNGAGKTTTMRVLATLEQPTRGDAGICGFSVVSDPERARKRLGFMPDHFGVDHYLDCREYLDFFARAYGLVGRDRHRAVERTIAFTGLEPVADKLLPALSKGMRQRLCLGRALIHDPDALILDEPASGLDPRARIDLRQMIGELAADGKAILVSSHILTELSTVADEIGIIEKGRLIAAGSVAEIRQQVQQRRVIEVELSRSADRFQTWLESCSSVSHIEREGSVFRFCDNDGESADGSQMLGQIVAAGFQVSRFGTCDHSLEDLFMELTKGEVQ